LIGGAPRRQSILWFYTNSQKCDNTFVNWYKTQ
jgi:hypothetical protein